jgi:quercetin dioxygenase-like cupin family protein
MATQREIAWPAELDAMVAAPDHHTLLLENERVRVLDSVIRPGESTPVHTHEWPGVLYIIGISDFVRRDDRHNVIFDSRTASSTAAAGQAFWSGPLQPHYVENVGKGEIRVISVELKEQPAGVPDKLLLPDEG